MPIILLHDAEGGIITVELKNGEVCRGLLDEAEDSMNLVLKVIYRQKRLQYFQHDSHTTSVGKTICVMR